MDMLLSGLAGLVLGVGWAVWRLKGKRTWRQTVHAMLGAGGTGEEDPDPRP